MLQQWLFLLLLEPVIIPAIYGKVQQKKQKDDDGQRCQDREIHNSTVLGGLLMKSQGVTAEELKVQNVPNITFMEFSFKNPVMIRGWDLKGRVGEMFGPFTKRRGYVASYIVTYVAGDNDEEVRKGAPEDKVKILRDPDTKLEEFISESNLARPEAVTDVDLPEPLTTQTLRIAPVVWSGVPFMSIKLFFCANDDDLSTEEKKAAESDEKEQSVEDMEKELKTTRTSGVLAAAVDATKSAMGIKTPRQEAEEFVEKPRQLSHLPFTHCANPPVWRYTHKPTPADSFSARGNPQQAWRAIMGVAYTPYLFPTDTNSNANSNAANRSKNMLLEVLFRSRSHVTGLKVAGLGEVGGDDGKWGVVKNFSLLYKGEDKQKWVYYSDESGTPRVFTVGDRGKMDAQKISVFHLPVGISTEALGIFPHSWINKPYLAIDILACYITGSGEIPPEESPFNKKNTKPSSTKVEEKEEDEDEEAEKDAEENDNGEKSTDDTKTPTSGGKKKALTVKKNTTPSSTKVEEKEKDKDEEAEKDAEENDNDEESTDDTKTPTSGGKKKAVTVKKPKNKKQETMKEAGEDEGGEVENNQPTPENASPVQSKPEKIEAKIKVEKMAASETPASQDKQTQLSIAEQNGKETIKAVEEERDRQSNPPMPETVSPVQPTTAINEQKTNGAVENAVGSEPPPPPEIKQLEIAIGEKGGKPSEMDEGAKDNGKDIQLKMREEEKQQEAQGLPDNVKTMLKDKEKAGEVLLTQLQESVQQTVDGGPLKNKKKLRPAKKKKEKKKKKKEKKKKKKEKKKKKKEKRVRKKKKKEKKKRKKPKGGSEKSPEGDMGLSDQEVLDKAAEVEKSVEKLEKESVDEEEDNDDDEDDVGSKKKGRERRKRRDYQFALDMMRDEDPSYPSYNLVDILWPD